MKILIAGLSVRALAESAVGSGCAVVALDAFGDRDTRALAETYSLPDDFHMPYSAEALVAAGRRLEFDAVAYTANLENHPDALGRLADGKLLLGNPPGVLRTVRSPAALFPDLRRAGFPVPETLIGAGPPPGDGRRWLVKPLSGGGGRGVGFAGEATAGGREALLQEFIPGKPCSASFLADGRDAIVLGVTEQLVGMEPFGARGFHYCGSILPLPESIHPVTGPGILHQVSRLAAFLSRQYGLRGLNGIDFILRGDRVYTIEVNPRYSASMELVEAARRLPLFGLHMDAVIHGKLPRFGLGARTGVETFFGKAILFARREVRIPDTSGWPDRQIRDIPAPGETIRAGLPVCTILTVQPAYAEVLRALEERAARIQDELYA